MAKKLVKPLDDPPSASSSDDELVDSSGEEEEEEVSSSEADEPTDPIKAPSSAVTVAFPGKYAAGSVPKNEVTIALALPAPQSAKKRPIEANSSDSKAKRAKTDTGEESKKPAFQRLWTEEDEITVLQGMIDFKAETNKSPYEDTNGYYEFIKKSISFEVSKNQFMDKIRSLKKKYINKEKSAFTKLHDQKSFDLAKYIWGPEGMGLESVVRSNGVSKKTPKTKKLESVRQELALEEGDFEKSDWFENSFLVKSISSFGVDEENVKRRWSLVKVENKKKIEEKYKDLQAREYEYVLQKTELLQEVTSIIAEVSKNK